MVEKQRSRSFCHKQHAECSAEQEQVVEARNRLPFLNIQEPEQWLRVEKKKALEHVEQGG